MKLEWLLLLVVVNLFQERFCWLLVRNSIYSLQFSINILYIYFNFFKPFVCAFLRLYTEIVPGMVMVTHFDLFNLRHYVMINRFNTKYHSEWCQYTNKNNDRALVNLNGMQPVYIPLPLQHSYDDMSDMLWHDILLMSR